MIKILAFCPICGTEFFSNFQSLRWINARLATSGLLVPTESWCKLHDGNGASSTGRWLSHCLSVCVSAHCLSVSLPMAIHPSIIKSLAPGRCCCNLRLIIFKFISWTDIWSISFEISLMRMPQDLTNYQSTLVQIMPWCCKATSHYLSQCWPDLYRHMASLGHSELTH